MFAEHLRLWYLSRPPEKIIIFCGELPPFKLFRRCLSIDVDPSKTSAFFPSHSIAATGYGYDGDDRSEDYGRCSVRSRHGEGSYEG